MCILPLSDTQRGLSVTQLVSDRPWPEPKISFYKSSTSLNMPLMSEELYWMCQVFTVISLKWNGSTLGGSLGVGFVVGLERKT